MTSLPTGLAQDAAFRLALQRADGPVDAALCLVADREGALRGHRHAFLHPRELARLDGMLAKRGADFLVGRYACKRAIAQLLADHAPTGWCIEPGVFSQPLLRSRHYLGLQVSISHGAGIGAALATPEGHPMAIDIEHYDAASIDAISGQMTAEELNRLATLNLPRLKALTTLWAMKEALSKVLRCGLMTPFTLLELDRFDCAGRQTSGSFRHFSQYQALAIDLGDFACAVVLPRATHGLRLDHLAEAFSPPTD